MANKSSKAVFVYAGHAQVVTTGQKYGGKQNDINCNCAGTKGKQSYSYQRTAKTSSVDKQTGAYSLLKTKKVISTGDTFKERPTGRVGIKNEHRTTNTFRVGDKSGYSEYQVQERFRRVDYGGNSSSKANSIKGISSCNRNNSIKGSTRNKAGSNSKGISSTKISISTKGNYSTTGSSSNKGNHSTKVSFSTSGSYYRK